MRSFARMQSRYSVICRRHPSSRRTLALSGPGTWTQIAGDGTDIDHGGFPLVQRRPGSSGTSPRLGVTAASGQERLSLRLSPLLLAQAAFLTAG
jgi:hypothetical protein